MQDNQIPPFHGTTDADLKVVNKLGSTDCNVDSACKITVYDVTRSENNSIQMDCDIFANLVTVTKNIGVNRVIPNSILPFVQYDTRTSCCPDPICICNVCRLFFSQGHCYCAKTSHLFISTCIVKSMVLVCIADVDNKHCNNTYKFPVDDITRSRHKQTACNRPIIVTHEYCNLIHLTVQSQRNIVSPPSTRSVAISVNGNSVLAIGGCTNCDNVDIVKSCSFELL